MSGYDEVLLFCEDIAGGPSVRLLELARARLQTEFSIALSVSVEAAGSVTNLRPLVDAERRQGRHAFAVRDRDFLERSLVNEQRAAHFGNAASVHPWPLSRHNIESYLLDPAFLTAAIPNGNLVWTQVLQESAEARRWTDVARAAINDLNWRLRSARAQNEQGDAEAANRDDAIAVVRGACVAAEPLLAAELAEERCIAKLDAFDRDFSDDGPLPHRVDGRELLKAVVRRLDANEPRGGLLPALLAHAERTGGPPAPLVDDVPVLLEGIQAQAGG